MRRRATRRLGTRGPYRWTDEAIERELRSELAGRTVFPTLVELDSLGRADLRAAVTDHGGVAYWADRLGLELPASRAQDPYRHEDVLRDACRVIEEHGRLPNERTLRKLGFGRLATAVRNAGGAKAFAAQHRL